MFVYADNAATTAMSRAAVEAMTPAMHQLYGNPSSLHQKGREANYALMGAREAVARCLNASAREIYFTGCGTEADNWAITEAARLGAEQGKRHIISDTIEHHAVLHTLKKLEKQGFEVTYLPVHGDGVVRLEELAAALRPDTCLVTIMFSNNEIGTIQPVREIGAVCREKGVLFHTDAVQAVGHIPVDVQKMGVDMLSLSAHKFGGPRGVGVLYCRAGVPLDPFLFGGGQERGRRPGTENTAAIVSMAVAMREACENMERAAEYTGNLRDKLVERILEIPGAHINGSLTNRLPGNINCRFDGVEGEALVIMLDLAGVCVSAGSACTSGSGEPSHVLTAMGQSRRDAYGAIRITLAETNTEAEVEYIADRLASIVSDLRKG